MIHILIIDDEDPIRNLLARMVEKNKTINWNPESTGTGRFGNWLENLNDGNLSRSRFWDSLPKVTDSGRTLTPLPEKNYENDYVYLADRTKRKTVSIRNYLPRIRS